MRLRSAVGAIACAVTALVTYGAGATEPAERRIAASSASELREWGSKVERMLSEGTLAVRKVEADTMIAGRQHERLAQRYKGVTVWGGEIVRQTSDAGTVSLFGTIYEGIDIGTAPKLSAAQAEAVVVRLGGRPFGEDGPATLLVYPRKDGSYVLAYKIRAIHSGKGLAVRVYFVDATTGAVVHSYDDLKTQSAPGAAVGIGTGVLNDRKKVSAKTQGQAFVTADVLRPAQTLTYDFKGSIQKVTSVIDAVYETLSFDPFLSSDLAIDTDNTWTDGAVVDAHVYAGYTYDYYFKRFGRRGTNDRNNLAVRNIVHPAVREAVFDNLDFLIFYTNAAYFGSGIVVFGEGLPPNVRTTAGQNWNYTSGSLDLVGHELTHGVTQYSSDLIYENEPGALNESFSDIMGTSIEFFFQPEKADYLAAEDVVTPGGIRSLQNPIAYGDPDHYSIRFLGSEDNGGVHFNSGIPNHAFYLAIEGGTNRVSGISVRGVGSANRDQIEKVMYRAFTLLMPQNASFSTARAVTIQAARDLYPSNPAVEGAITQAWTAVGVN